MAGTHNPLLPEMATVIETVQETHNIKTFRVRFDDEEKMKNFTFQPGQVGQLSVFGVGLPPVLRDEGRRKYRRPP